VIIAATAIGMFAGIFSVTFLKGWMNQRLEAGVETELSHLQMHHPLFLENYDPKMLIPEGENISNRLRDIPGVDGASPRIVMPSMVSSAETGTGAKVIGINPDKEKTTTNLHKHIIEGTYFEDGTRNPVVIGEKLAKKLNVKLKSKIVITFQDWQGNITSGAFRVAGIYDIVNNGFEELNLFVHSENLIDLIHLPEGSVHEITIHTLNSRSVDNTKTVVAGIFPDQEVLTWVELTPEFGFIVEIGDVYAYLVVIIILLALGFGIVNTMLMVVLERVKEIGMLMAVGMNKTRVFLMLMLETVLLTFAGGAIGIAGGIVFCLATRKNGINLSMYAQGLEEIGHSSVIHPVLEARIIFTISLLVIATGILASVYPARKAIKYNPADALRIDM